MWIDWNNDTKFNNTIGNDEIVYDSGTNICQNKGDNLILNFTKSLPTFVTNPEGYKMRMVLGNTNDGGNYDGTTCQTDNNYGDIRDITIQSIDTEAKTFTDPHFKYPTNEKDQNNKKNKNYKKIWTPKFPLEGWYNWISTCNFFVNGKVENEGNHGQQWNTGFYFNFNNETRIKIFIVYAKKEENKTKSKLNIFINRNHVQIGNIKNKIVLTNNSDIIMIIQNAHTIFIQYKKTFDFKIIMNVISYPKIQQIVSYFDLHF